MARRKTKSSSLYDNAPEEVIRIARSELERMVHTMWFEGYESAVHNLADCFADSPLPFGEKIAENIVEDFEEHREDIWEMFSVDFVTENDGSDAADTKLEEGAELKRTTQKAFFMPESPSKYYN